LKVAARKKLRKRAARQLELLTPVNLCALGLPMASASLRGSRGSLQSDKRGAVFNSRLAPQAPLLAPDDAPPVEWVVTPGLTQYSDALAEMEARAEAIARGDAPERVWLIEHPPLYTAGTSAKDSDLVDARFPVHRTGRGGQFTYHGPGQRVAYVMLDLKRRRPDVRAYVASLERWLIDALRTFDVVGETRETRVGVWVARPDKPASPLGEMAEDKIAAIGVRVRRWATLHGVSLNVDPDLIHFSGIVPCGVAEAHYGVTSLADLGRAATMAQADAALRAAFETVFGPTRSG
jgi:lipoyl(octanoyl) transferase